MRYVTVAACFVASFILAAWSLSIIYACNEYLVSHSIIQEFTYLEPGHELIKVFVLGCLYGGLAFAGIRMLPSGSVVTRLIAAVSVVINLLFLCGYWLFYEDNFYIAMMCGYEMLICIGLLVYAFLKALPRRAVQ